MTGTCYEHAHVLGSPPRLEWFEGELSSYLQTMDIPCVAWVVLPNHYHVLVAIESIVAFTREPGKLHGRTAYPMNLEDNAMGRKVWFRCQDRGLRSEAHYFATLNYIHNNAAKHGYVAKSGDWPFSSFDSYLEEKGRDWLVDLWHAYPVLNYGDKWDP